MAATGRPEMGPQYYDDIYSKDYDTDRYKPLYDLILQFLASYGRPRVLEVGCGTGTLGKLIVQAGYEYRGFDFSSVAVDKARQECPRGDFRVGNAYDTDMYQPYDYDVVIALEVLEHLDDIAVIDQLPPGARLIASVPDFDNEAHLRTYSDPQKDIVGRFKDRLQLVSCRSLAGASEHGQALTLYIFDAVRLFSDEWFKAQAAKEEELETVS